VWSFSNGPRPTRAPLSTKWPPVANHVCPQQPFFNLTLQAGNPRLAAIFVPKCAPREPGATITMYEKCGMKVKAAEEAVRLKDVENWTRLLEAAGRGTQEGREIERLGNPVFKK
jgi:vacuolar protein sorting-associated protein 16